MTGRTGGSASASLQARACGGRARLVQVRQPDEEGLVPRVLQRLQAVEWGRDAWSAAGLYAM